ncbi:MAG: M12 family metallo-peptidase [Bacteroidota bacterium]
MKFIARVLLLVILTIPFQSNGQFFRKLKKEVTGKPFTPSPMAYFRASEFFEEFQLIRFSDRDLVTLATTEITQGEVTLDFGKNMRFPIHLEPNDLKADNFRLRKHTLNGIEEVPYHEVNTYKGWVKTREGGEVRLTISGDFVYGYLESGDDTYYIEPAAPFVGTPSRNQYIIYNAADVVEPTHATCGVNTASHHRTHGSDPHASGITPLASGGCLETELAIAADYSMYNKHGGLNGVVDYMLGVMNNVEGDYTGGAFSDDIEFKVVEIVVSACDSCDFLTSSTDASTLLSGFYAWGATGGFENTFDLAQFWSNRDFDGSTIGLAYVGQVCNTFRYHILQDFSTNADLTRVLTTHEIGHNFNASHASTTGYIMSASVSNTSSWEAGSVTSIDAYAEGVGCLGSCAAPTCDSLDDVSFTYAGGNQVQLSWQSSADSVRIRVRPTSSGTWSTEAVVKSGNTYTTSTLAACTDYVAELSRKCGASTFGAATTVRFNSSYFQVDTLYTDNCGNGSFDLVVGLSHNGGSGNIQLTAGSNTYTSAYSGGSQTLTWMDILPNNGSANIELVIQDASVGSGACRVETTFDAPSERCDCDTIQSEDFNSACSLPTGWTNATTNPFAWTNPYAWKFDDGSRSSLNYSSGTLDGTCMAYFDDDINNNASFTGTNTLTTPAVDITGYEDATLSFDYDFHSFFSGKSANSSAFSVDVYDGTTWQNVLSVTNTENCGFSTFWSCSPSRFTVNVDAYRNANFQVRFVYTDGDTGDWTGAVGVDNYLLCGYIAPTIPTTIALGIGTYTADSQLVDANGWTHFIKSAGTAPVTSSDILLLSLQKNGDDSLMVSPGDVTVGVTGIGGAVDLGMDAPNPAPYVTNPDGWFVMNRYWDINPGKQPNGNVNVRTYYTTYDYTGVSTAVNNASGSIASHTDLVCFKFSTGSGVNPNPTATPPHSGGTTGNYLELAHAYGSYDTVHYVQFSTTGFSGGGIGGGGGSVNSPLTLDMLVFEGKLLENRIELSWIAEEQPSSVPYHVEKSLTGSSFREVGFVEAGTSGQVSYKFDDMNPAPGKNYYRLVCEQPDGTSKASATVEVTWEQQVQPLLFPNPFSEKLVLRFPGTYSGPASIAVFNLQGQQVIYRDWDAVDKREYEFLSGELADGIYLFHVRTRNDEIRGRILKKK